MPKTFMDRYLASEVEPEDIDTFVDEWHEGTSVLSLAEYLGLSPEEYCLWVLQADALPRIREARRVKA